MSVLNKTQGIFKKKIQVTGFYLIFWSFIAFCVFRLFKIMFNMKKMYKRQLFNDMFVLMGLIVTIAKFYS